MSTTYDVVMIDNYDSFTFNLVQYLQQAGLQVHTVRNDAHGVPALLDLKPKFFVLSPGPSNPDNAGVCLQLTEACAQEKIPLLGVCLGHQTIAQAFGGKIVRADLPMHGKVTTIQTEPKGVFEDLPRAIKGTRYHSLVVDPATLAADFDVTAKSEDGVIMGILHKSLPLEGIQFHPESVLTEHGHAMLRNFAGRCGA